MVSQHANYVAPLNAFTGRLLHEVHRTVRRRRRDRGGRPAVHPGSPTHASVLSALGRSKWHGDRGTEFTFFFAQFA